MRHPQHPSESIGAAGGLHPTVVGWVARVATNGGTAPSVNTKNRASTFCSALDSAGIMGKMLVVNFFAPESLITASTPLIVSPNSGYDPWGVGANVGTLSANGVQGVNTDTGFDTGIVPLALWATQNDVGLTLYFYANPTDGGKTELECAAGEGRIRLYCYSGDLTMSNLDDVGPAAHLPLFTGYAHGSRTGATTRSLYTASSGSAHALQASANYTDTVGDALPNADTYVLGGTGASTDVTLSFCAFSYGLTQGQSLALYNAVQALRTGLGGGFV